MAHKNAQQDDLINQTDLDLELGDAFDLAISSMELADANLTYDDSKLLGHGAPYFSDSFPCACGSSESRQCSRTSLPSVKTGSSSWTLEDFTMPQLKTVQSDTINGKKEVRRSH